MLKNSKKIVEKLIGPLTVGSLLKGYRMTHELTLDQMCKKLKLTKPLLQRIEAGKHHLTLKEVVAFTKKLDEPKYVYARVWCEEQARLVGLDFDDIIKVI